MVLAGTPIVPYEVVAMEKKYWLLPLCIVNSLSNSTRLEKKSKISFMYSIELLPARLKEPCKNPALDSTDIIDGNNKANSSSKTYLAKKIRRLIQKEIFNCYMLSRIWQ